MASPGRPLVFVESLARAFKIGTAALAASEQAATSTEWRAFVANTGLTARSLRRYMRFAQWAAANPRAFGQLLALRPQPSFLDLPRLAKMAWMLDRMSG